MSLPGDSREVKVVGFDVIEETPQKVVLNVQVHLQVEHDSKSVSTRLSKIDVRLVGRTVGDGNDSHGGR